MNEKKRNEIVIEQYQIDRINEKFPDSGTCNNYTVLFDCERYK